MKNRHLRCASLLLLFFTITATSAYSADKPAKENWIQLFNGKNLDGWKVKIRGHKLGDNFGNTFRVEDGLLKVSYDQYEKFDEKFGHIFYEKPFSHYLLRMEYRFEGDQVPGGPGWATRNSGAMLHGEAPEDMGIDQKFPTSIEMQLLGGNGKANRTTANLCTPGTNVVMDGKLITRHCISSKSKTYHGEKWVTVEIEVRGNQVIKHIMDGKTVLEYNKPQLDDRDEHAKALIKKYGGKQLTGGTISLQSESHPISFRKVELLELKKPQAQSQAKPFLPKNIKPTRVVATSSDDVEEHLDIDYAQYGERKMQLDLFVPKNVAGPKPTVAVIHGGGWMKGNKSGFRGLAQALAARGYVTAAVGYRLGGEAKFPAAIQDCNAAVRWLRANHKKYGIDPNRIGAVGGSAGGHLVGLMAAAADVELMQGSGGNANESSALQAAVVMAGPLELATGKVADRSREIEDFFSNRWLGKTVDEDVEIYKLASPFRHISKTTSPMLFMTGEYDFPERNFPSREKLNALGIETGIKVYKYGKHGCWNQYPWFDIMVDDIDSFLSTTLKKSPAQQSLHFLDANWGEIRRSVNRLELVISKPPKDGKITIPRLNNPIGVVYLKGDSKQKPLQLKPGLDDWTIQLKSKAIDPGTTIIVETIGTAFLPTVPQIVNSNKTGAVTLAAHNAVTHGKLLRYEPQPHKNTVGYWANEADWCEWHFYLDQPGNFDVHILQGCGKGQGGSTVAVSVGEQNVKFTVEDTGHFQNFKDRKIGTMSFSTSGLHTLKIKPISKAKNAVMDVRQVRLVPAK